MLHDPSPIGVREQTVALWKTRYVHAYRKAHRAHYEAVAARAAKLETPASQGTSPNTDEWHR